MIEISIFLLIAFCVSSFTLGMAITNFIWSKKYMNYLLREQQRIVGEYLHTLEMRAVIEEIDLNSFCK